MSPHRPKGNMNEEFQQLRKDMHELYKEVVGNQKITTDNEKTPEEKKKEAFTPKKEDSLKMRILRTMEQGDLGPVHLEEKVNKRWKQAPMVQLSTTITKIGTWRFTSVVLETTPYEFEESTQDPLQYYEVFGNRLVDINTTEGKRLKMAQEKKLPRSQGGQATIVQANIQVWSRSLSPRTRLTCHCDHQYTPNDRKHDDKTHCQAYGIGAAIAAKIWADEAIDGMIIEEELLN